MKLAVLYLKKNIYTLFLLLHLKMVLFSFTLPETQKALIMFLKKVSIFKLFH